MRIGKVLRTTMSGTPALLRLCQLNQKHSFRESCSKIKAILKPACFSDARRTYIACSMIAIGNSFYKENNLSIHMLTLLSELGTSPASDSGREGVLLGSVAESLWNIHLWRSWKSLECPHFTPMPICLLSSLCPERAPNIERWERVWI